MSSNNIINYETMKNLPVKIRKKAFELALALSTEDVDPDIIIPMAISGAKYWAAHSKGKK
jgi:uncharacterized protein YdaT